MQQDPKKVADENKDEEEHIDTINFEVIEQNEDKTEKNLDEPQPSTSHDVSPKTSRKFMKCVHCEKKFTHKGDLNKHMRKHTGEQPFTCSVCDRKFAHTSNLARHMRLHSGDRPFSCEICNKNFSRKDKLELHRKSKCCKKTS
ncbi:zf-H2C2 2 domain containing protein [Asbolus verrucosus]|uniref:Zf-H2C2 2 domain containing protein n=1 Tax=Asbolus verrucosus TaxID=1661398 RepID=A0A482VZG4_ASBVE|nr:zf-H2C2 2 domain containing protein [Asbolus verrucosus]